MKRLFALVLILTLFLSFFGCAPLDTDTPPVYIEGEEDIFSEKDLDWGYDSSEAVKIVFSDIGVTTSSPAVKVEDGCVTIANGGTYLVSGKAESGSIKISASDNDKVQLVLQSLSLGTEGYATIYANTADKLFITLEGESKLSSIGDIISENGVDGAIFARCDMTVNGTGSLLVECESGHGIVAKDELAIVNSTLSVKAASHGIDANDSIAVKDANLTLECGKDGLHAEHSEDSSLGFIFIKGGTEVISAEGDGISASSYVQIEGGSFNIVTGGGYVNAEDKVSDGWGGFPGRPGGPGGPGGMSSTTTTDDGESIKGIKGGTGLLIKDGTFTIDSADDALHSNADLTVAGGRFSLSSGDDGLHADESLFIDGGIIDISTSYEGLEGLNVYVKSGEIKLVASDDGINAAGGVDGSGMGGMRPGQDHFSSSGGSINISGGRLDITASGDGIDANGTLSITGGFTTVTGPTSGDTATLDYDVSASITGGTFIGTGARGMAQTFSESSQGVIAVSVGGSLAAGSLITLTDSSGNTVVEHTPTLDFAIVIISTPEMKKGETYNIRIGDTEGSFAAS